MTPPASEPEPITSDRVIFVLTEQRLRRLLALCRVTLWWLTLAYGVGLFVLLAGLEWVGERFWPFGVLLYGPPHLVLLPLAALTPCCLVLHWRLCFWHLVYTAGVFFVFMTFRVTLPSKPTAGEVTAISFNQGQGSRSQFMSFATQKKPDLILLQDASWRASTFKSLFPGASVAEVGEFILVSRFPIQESAIVEPLRDDRHPVAARFEVIAHGQPLAIYIIHLSTPRDRLSRFIGGRRVAADLLGARGRGPVFSDYRAWLKTRTETAGRLAAILDAEKLPFIVGGDLNTPDHGQIYHRFTENMTDAFAAAGNGWGLTFPGVSHRLLTLYGPWLRIDYLFAGRGWKPVECSAENGRKSQHRAVFARFRPQPASP